jgi:ferredoxin
MTIRASIDFDECEGHGICARVASEIFKVDEDGNAEVLLEVVPPELRAKAMLAMRQCPTQAISVAELDD